jgi:hypothetical protein
VEGWDEELSTRKASHPIRTTLLDLSPGDAASFASILSTPVVPHSFLGDIFQNELTTYTSSVVRLNLLSPRAIPSCTNGVPYSLQSGLR